MVKIMVVDDDPSTLKVLQRIFIRHGYEVSMASNGKSCLEKIETEKPDIVFLDITMPDMDGWEVCRRIKENPSTRFIKVSMLSSRKSRDDIKKSFDAGADEHLTKPIRFNEVLKTTAAFIKSKERVPVRVSVELVG